MHFMNPVLLWALLLIPPAGALTVWIAWQRKQELQGHFGEERLVSRYSKPLRKQAYQFKALWVFLTLASLVIALARPVVENGTTEYPIGTVDVVAIVDVSRSMAVPDYDGKLKGPYYSGGTRLDMARYLIVNQVVPSLNANRMGVVSFCGEAFPQAFITDDMPALGWVLKRALKIGSAPGDGSSVGKAFKLAFQLFDLDSDKDHRKVLVFFSDGGNDDGDEALAAIAAQCRARGIEVVIVGLGSPMPSAIPIKQLSPLDQQRYWGHQWYEYDGEVVKTGLEENTLLALKNAVGGRYVRVVNPGDFQMGSLISRAEVRYKKSEQELFMYPLMAALLFLVCTILASREWKPEAASPRGTTPKQRRR